MSRAVLGNWKAPGPPHQIKISANIFDERGSMKKKF